MTEKQRMAWRAWYDARKKAGLCIKCKTNVAQAGRTLCFQCALRESERSQERHRKKKEGLAG